MRFAVNVLVGVLLVALAGGAAAVSPPANGKPGQAGAAARTKRPLFIVGSYRYPVDDSPWATKDDPINRKELVDKLLDMGFTQQESYDALKAQGWDMDNAVNYLSSFTNGKRSVVPCIVKDECWKTDGEDARPQERQVAKTPSIQEDMERGKEMRRIQQLADNVELQRRAELAQQRGPRTESAAQKRARANALANANQAQSKNGEARPALLLEVESEVEADSSSRGFFDKVKSFAKAAVDKVKSFFSPKPAEEKKPEPPKPEPKKPDPPKVPEKPKKMVTITVPDPRYPMTLRPVVYPVGSEAEARRAEASVHEPGIRYQVGDPNNPAASEISTPGPGTDRGTSQGQQHHRHNRPTVSEAQTAADLSAKGRDPIGAPMRPDSKSRDPFIVEMRRRMAGDLAQQGWMSGPPGWLKAKIREHARIRAERSRSNSATSELWPVIVPVRVTEDSQGREHDSWSHPVVPQQVPLREVVRTGPIAMMKAPGSTGDAPAHLEAPPPRDGAGTPGTFPPGEVIPQDQI